MNENQQNPSPAKSQPAPLSTCKCGHLYQHHHLRSSKWVWEPCSVEGCGCGGFEQEEMRQQDNGKANQATEHREIHPMDVCVCGRERRLHNNNQMRLDWECAYGGFTLARFYDRAQGKPDITLDLDRRLTKLEWAMQTASQLNRADQPEAWWHDQAKAQAEEAWWHDQAKAQAEIDERVKEQQEANLTSPFTDDNNPPPIAQFTPKSAEPAPRYDLIPTYALRLLAEVFGEGAVKYSHTDAALNLDKLTFPLNRDWWVDRQNHAQDHWLDYHAGDRSVPHLAKVMWYCAMRIAVDQREKEQVERVEQVRANALSST